MMLELRLAMPVHEVHQIFDVPSQTSLRNGDGAHILPL